MRQGIAKYLLALSALCVLAALSACARPRGYGLVLWVEKDSPFKNGEVVPVLKESHLQKTLLVRAPGSRQIQELPAFRVRLFPSQGAARQAARQYEPFTALYGYAKRDGLPLREKPDQEAKMVYKLRARQLVKVLEKSAEAASVGGYSDFWYGVLTDDGLEGWCFGYTLTLFTALEDPRLEAEKILARDPSLEKLFSTTWRPEYFSTMAAKNRIDLAQFRSEIGLFPDQEKKVLQLVMPAFSQSFSYESVEKIGEDRYRFPPTDLRLQVEQGKRIVLNYTRSGQIMSTVLEDFETDPQEIIAKELERRQALFREFRSRGSRMQSSAYGTVELQEEMGFRWSGFERLASQSERLFPRPVTGGGKIDFPFFLAEELKTSYDGVIAFRFAEYGPQEATSFLYKFTAEGVRFEFVPPREIVELEVKRKQMTPLVVFFTFGRS